VLEGKIKVNKNKAFPHNCIGNILSIGIFGKVKPNKLMNPLKSKKAKKIIRYLFI